MADNLQGWPGGSLGLPRSPVVWAQYVYRSDSDLLDDAEGFSEQV